MMLLLYIDTETLSNIKPENERTKMKGHRCKNEETETKLSQTPPAAPVTHPPQKKMQKKKPPCNKITLTVIMTKSYLLLCRFFLSIFFRLCVAIFWRFRFFPQGTMGTP